MDNVIELNGFMPVGSCIEAETCCWLCQKGNPIRAFFCQHCGTIQPVRSLDHFARLGVERRIDVDLKQLDGQYTNLHQLFSPERFKIRGLGERGHAAGQLSAVEEAYLTLRDPIRRARYWMELHQQEVSKCETDNPMVEELRTELQKAEVASQCDRVAHRAGRAMEYSVVGVMQALRGYNWDLANSLLCELNGLESLLEVVPEVRAKLLSKIPPSDTESIFRRE